MKTCQNGMKAMIEVGEGCSKNIWLINSSASSHRTSKINSLSDTQDYFGSTSITIGNEQLWTWIVHLPHLDCHDHI